MARKKHSAEQVVNKLREAEVAIAGGRSSSLQNILCSNPLEIFSSLGMGNGNTYRLNWSATVKVKPISLFFALIAIFPRNNTRKART